MTVLEPQTGGRAAQRRRTRGAIVQATMRLLSEGVDPSINEIAAAADVSRRTVYMYYPTLDQLVLDATIGLINVGVDDALQQVSSDDPAERIGVLINAVYATMERSLPLGRRLIKLTVTADPPAGGGSRRGHRRIQWLEWALLPLHRTLPKRRYDDLLSALAVVIGWESFIVLLDVRGLSPRRAREVTRRAALALLADAVAP